MQRNKVTTFKRADEYDALLHLLGGCFGDDQGHDQVDKSESRPGDEQAEQGQQADKGGVNIEAHTPAIMRLVVLRVSGL